jgi:hypothetical protein
LPSCRCDELPSDTFEAIERRVFARHACTTLGCHGSTPAAAGLVLTGTDVYAHLVSVASATDGDILRVAPGDPDRSMLWLKLAARTIDLPNVPGSEMPIGDPAVGEAELEAIRQWILAGAPETGTVAAAQDLLACDVP